MQARNTQEPSPSITALSVAEGLYQCSRLNEWQHLVHPDAALLTKHFIDHGLKNSKHSLPWLFFKSVNHVPGRLALHMFNAVGGSIHGYFQHCAMRKLFIEQQVRDSIAHGCKRVIVLGGGYDTLCLRLHTEFPDVQFYELDRGATRNIKLKAIEALTFVNDDKLLRFKQLGENLHFVASDFSQSNWPEEFIQSTQFDPQAQSVIVAEGLTMYLSQQEVDSLIDNLRNKLIMHEGSKLIMSFIGDATINKLLSSQLQANHESFKCTKTCEEVIQFANEKQLGLIGRITGLDFQKQATNDDVVNTMNKRKDNRKDEDYYVFSFAKNYTNPLTPELVPNLSVDTPLPHSQETYYARRCI